MSFLGKSLSSAFANTPNKGRKLDQQDASKKRSRLLDADDTPMISPPHTKVAAGVLREANKSRGMFKVFNDLVHTNIKLDEVCVRIVDSHEFQRLHSLKQLGTSDYVFRGATHTRFEHSLGVAHLAERVAMILKENQPELGITEKDVLCVKIAGLCHDLGHGPFSHVYDGGFIKQMYKHGIDEQGSKWRHEDGSVRMFSQLLHSNGIKLARYGLDESDKLFIDEIIGGVEEKHRKGRGPEKFYLYDIVNNNRSGLDVDKLDYFERDMRMTAVTVKPFSAERFIESGYVMRAQPIVDISDKNANHYCRSPRPNSISQEEYDTLPLMICYPEKLCEEAVEIFGVRYNMHKKVYTNKAVKKIEYMICDALRMADPFIQIQGSPSDKRPDGLYRMSECIYDMAALSNLDDSIIKVIMHDRRPELAQAKALLQRIERRKLYACVGSTSSMKRDADEMDTMSEEDIEQQILDLSQTLVDQPCPYGYCNSQAYPQSSQSQDQLGSTFDREYDAAGDELLGLAPIIREDTNFSVFSQSSQSGGTTFGAALVPGDIIIERMHVHYGLKDKNPVARLRFYAKGDRDGGVDRPVARMLKEESYEASLPRSFEDRRIRVFCRFREKERIARRAFEMFCEHVKAHSPFPSFSQVDPDPHTDPPQLAMGLGLGGGAYSYSNSYSNDVVSPTPMRAHSAAGLDDSI